MIKIAQSQFPHIPFTTMCAEEITLSEKYDTIIMSNLVGVLPDVEKAFCQLGQVSHCGTRIIVTYYNRLWEPSLRQAEKLKLNNYLFARPLPDKSMYTEDASTSIIIPARNEAGNIEDAITRIPDFGKFVEIIFVEGNSTDNTWDVIRETQQKYANTHNIKILQQPGKGKGDAVRAGFKEATGDILMILDADLTVAPEVLPRFHQALTRRKGDFINGVRLVYPMEKNAMRPLNTVGNYFFSILFSWLLEQPIKDTLCGTKVMYKSDYLKLAANRPFFGEFDPFGDFDLLFGAYKLNLKIIDLPIRYQERKYGDTNISRFSHGLILLKMAAFAAAKIKFW
jgi:glycosyltransferase involved in cell wall biosynthesis